MCLWQGSFLNSFISLDKICHIYHIYIFFLFCISLAFKRFKLFLCVTLNTFELEEILQSFCLCTIRAKPLLGSKMTSNYPFDPLIGSSLLFCEHN